MHGLGDLSGNAPDSSEEKRNGSRRFTRQPAAGWERETIVAAALRSTNDGSATTRPVSASTRSGLTCRVCEDARGRALVPVPESVPARSGSGTSFSPCSGSKGRAARLRLPHGSRASDRQQKSQEPAAPRDLYPSHAAAPPRGSELRRPTLNAGTPTAMMTTPRTDGARIEEAPALLAAERAPQRRMEGMEGSRQPPSSFGEAVPASPGRGIPERRLPATRPRPGEKLAKQLRRAGADAGDLVQPHRVP